MKGECTPGFHLQEFGPKSELCHTPQTRTLVSCALGSILVKTEAYSI